MKYCVKCGLPHNYPGIQFNHNGICNYCNFYEIHKAELEDSQKRQEIFCEQVKLAKKRAAEANAPYDCVIGLSGGKDSTYIAWQMKHTYGLRVLAVTFQNGFHTEFGRNNIENALQKLDVEHISVRLNEQTLRSQYSKCVSLMKNFCSVCFHYGHYYCHMIAAKYGIPLVVNGRTKGQILQSARETKGIEPFDISLNLQEFEYQMFGKLVDKVAEMGYLDYLEHTEVTSLSYFAYHDVTEEETMRFLEKEIGWERPDTGIPHADCWAHPMAENLSIVKRGFPVRTGELAVLVRNGELTKKQASAMLEDDRKHYSEIAPRLEENFYKRIRPYQAKRG